LFSPSSAQNDVRIVGAPRAMNGEAFILPLHPEKRIFVRAIFSDDAVSNQVSIVRSFNAIAYETRNRMAQ
jgi:hypothetical protein